MENLDDALYAAEQEAQGGGEAFEITILSKFSGRKKAGFSVLSANTLNQVLVGNQKQFGFNLEDDQIMFENMRTHELTPEKEMTIGAFGIKPGDTLAITCDCKVA